MPVFLQTSPYGTPILCTKSIKEYFVDMKMRKPGFPFFKPILETAERMSLEIWEFDGKEHPCLACPVMTRHRCQRCWHCICPDHMEINNVHPYEDGPIIHQFLYCLPCFEAEHRCRSYFFLLFFCVLGATWTGISICETLFG